LQPADALANLRILVAEDESLIALNLEAMLEQFGCQVIGPVSNVHEIVRMAERQPLDGALVDVNLHGEQVFDALPALISRGVPIVLASGYDDATLFPEAFRALPRITKPFDERALRRICLETMRPAASS
jgi:DNA-binding NtrC family response regulator